MSILGTLKVMLTADTGQFSKDLKKGKQEVSSFKSEISGMAKGLAGAFTAGAVVAGIRDIVKTTADYSKQVEDLSRNLGVSTEEASKMLQITDDLEISESALEMGMKTALRNGITPNIEGIMDLAEQYQALNTPAERAAFAMKTFGKNGLEMAKILEKTPEQIQAMADSLEGSSLVMSRESVQAAKDYRLALDNMNDTIAEVKVELGNELIPVLNDALVAFNDLAGGTLSEMHAQKMVEDAQKKGFITIKEGNELINEMVFTDMSATEAKEILAEKTKNFTRAMELAGSEAVLSSSDVGAYNEILKNNAAAAGEAAEANDAMKYSIISLDKAYLAKEAIDALSKAVDEHTISAEEARAKQALIMSQWLEMPASEVNASLALQDLKKKTEGGAATWWDYYNAIGGTKAYMESMNGRKYTTYFELVTTGTNYHYTPPAGASSSSSSTSSTRPPYRAGGGGVDAGGAYIVGEHGPEPFVPRSSGNMTSNEDFVGLLKSIDKKLGALPRSIRDAVLKAA